MQICLVGLSHKTAPVEVRERVAVAPDSYAKTLVRMNHIEQLSECAILSTCNRTELYGLSSFYHDGIESLETALGELARESNVSLEDSLYRVNGMDAARHLFRVASSLDSLVVGEPQILGQIKEAYRAAADESTAGLVLNRLFRQAISVGKRVRSETEIGSLAVSVSSAAVELAEKIFGSLENRSALVIGAGDTAHVTLRHLEGAGVSHILIANRSLEKAEALARDFNARAVPLTALSENLAEADIVIASATSDKPILHRAEIEEAMKQRKSRTMFVIDIAVPRNVEARVGDVYNVYLYDIDDLQKVVEGNRSRRGQEAEKAEALVDEELRRFSSWWRGLDTIPTLVELRNKIEGLQQEETKRFLAKLQHLSQKDRELVEQFGVSLVKKILHDPTTQIKKTGGAERAATLASSLRYLFRLDEEEVEAQLGDRAEESLEESEARDDDMEMPA